MIIIQYNKLLLAKQTVAILTFILDGYFFILLIFFLFYLYIYPPDSQESDGGANTYDRQLP